ncbi:diguanylate cyclase [Acuticoccus sp. M5D2P5]|uniref:diguanylate cyclase domain-containing protein n=1 Tax=Acuticoccus kalidii TaxID=2910977 RepID=UPI001F2F8BFB|nr:diguanylate cyclase [Acuticoccus kalidii]MCF3936311.1 diguanylate cyclase [Acuticoccus kalidii]
MAQQVTAFSELWIADLDREDPVTAKRLDEHLFKRPCTVEDAALAELNERLNAAGHYVDHMLAVRCEDEVRHVLIRAVPVPATGRRLAIAVHDLSAEEGLRNALRQTHRALRELQLGQSMSDREALALAFSDSLTGLPNRRAFNAELTAACAAGDFALCLLDLDNFKDVNDALGHATGDRLLTEVAHILRRATRESDFVSRLAGDEFAVIFYGLDTVTGAQEATGRLLSRFSHRLDLDEIDLQVRLSAGIALGGPGGSPDEIYRKADIALHSAKTTHRGAAMIHADPTASLLDHDNLVIVKSFLTDKPLPIDVQPIIDPELNLVGHELSVGYVDFERILATAQRFAVGPDLVNVALRALCTAAARLTDPVGHTRITLPQYATVDADMPSRIVEAMTAARLDFSAVILEIPLAAFAHGTAPQLARALAAQGIRIALRGWDPGVNAFQRVRATQFDMVTFDARPIAPIITDKRLATIWRTAIASLREDGVSVTATNVESAALATRLFELGIDSVQSLALSNLHYDAHIAAKRSIRAA